MYTRARKGWKKHIDFFLLDVLMLELSLALSYWIRQGGNQTLERGFYYQLGMIVGVTSIFVGLGNESYRDILRRGYAKELRAAFVHVCLTYGLDIVATYFTKGYYYSRQVFLVAWFFGILFCYGSRCLWKKILIRNGESKSDERNVLLVTTYRKAKKAVKSLNNNSFKDYRLVGLVFTDHAEPGLTVENYPVFGRIDGDTSYLRENVIDEVLIQLPVGMMLEDKYINMFVQTGLTVHVDLGIPAKASSNYSVENFAGKVVLTRGMKLVSPGEMLLKRLMDICGAVVGLLITGLVSVFVSPAIKIADPGPAFFSQVRVGKNGRRFRIYKFRSMYMDAEERKAELMSQNEMQGPMFKMENDPRIIKGIGDFIRKTSIDELPQFWNVLNGTMSLVGTRPPTVNEYEQYEMEHLKRVSIKPGITGMWQTSGRNEITDFEEVVRLDTEYITNWSLGLDIKLLFKTVMVVFKREGSK